MRLIRTSRGFTLVEGLIAMVIGALVMGTGMYIYLQGDRSFKVTTEHASMRQESLLVLEKIERDLDQILVSNGRWPDGTREHYLFQPFRLTDPYTQQMADPNNPGKFIDYTEAGSGVEFFRYHHTEMVDNVNTLTETDDLMPQLVGHKITYKTEPFTLENGEQALNLFRNGVKINKIPLSEVIFARMPRIEAENQVQGSDHAILRVWVIPRGGVWRSMKREDVDRLKSDPSLLSKTYHLVGYESMYTTKVYVTMRKMRRFYDDDTNVLDEAALNTYLETADELEQRVVAEVRSAGESVLLDNLREGIDDRPARTGYGLPTNSVKLDFQTPYDNATARVDSVFASALDGGSGDQDTGSGQVGGGGGGTGGGAAGTSGT